MARPRVARIGHQHWRVMFSRGVVRAAGEEFGYELDGVCNTENQTIAVHPFPEAPDHERMVLVHELMHACLHETGLDLDKEDEERFIVALSPRLLDALQSNPTIVSYLLG